MSTILERIKAYKLEHIAACKTERPLARVEEEAQAAAPIRPFAEGLQAASMAGGYGLIAEIKKASPSKGLIREDFDPAALATAYRDGGAACLSILTDAPSFHGSDDFLRQVRASVDLPLLRKDFMYDPYQVVEARALGADCILIIMATLSDAQAAELENTAMDWGMDALIEVHNLEELDRALLLKSKMIGINNRDLHSFITTLETTKNLASYVTEDRLIVSESGLSTREDLADLAQYGIRAFLIGEALMRQENVESATRTLLSNPYQPEPA